MLALAVALAAPAGGATTLWQHDPASAGDWFAPANWTVGVPTSADKAYVDNAGTAVISSGTAESSYLCAGGAATGVVRQTGGTCSAGLFLVLGEIPGSTGTYELSGTGAVSAIYENVGWFGTGAFVHSGGTNTVTDALTVGDQIGSQGNYALTDAGQIFTKDLKVGNYGTGSFVQSGGTHTVTDNIFLGNYQGSNGTYQISGGTLDIANGIIYDGSTTGYGTLQIDGGTVIVDWLRLARGYGDFTSAGTAGVLRVNKLTDFTGSMSGSFQLGHSGGDGYGRYGVGETNSLDVGYDLVIGYDAPATLNQTGGTVTVGHFLDVGCGAGATGTYNLTTGALTAGSVRLGYGGVGTLDWASGTLDTGAVSVGPGGTLNGNVQWNFGGALTVAGGALDLGAHDLTLDASAGANITAGSLAARSLYLGSVGLGSLTQMGGTHTLSGQLYLGYSPGSNGMYTLTGTGQFSAVDEYVAYSGAATFLQSGGTNTVSHWLCLGHGAGSQGTYVLLAGQLSAGTIKIGQSGTGMLAWSGGQIFADAVDVYAGGSFSVGGHWAFQGDLNVAGGIVEMGTGELRLDGAGTSSISAGLLSAGSQYVGDTGTATVIQTGGDNSVRALVCLGRAGGADGTYRISGGSLTTTDLIVGLDGSGTLDVTGAAAEITLSGSLQFGADSALTCVPGTAIHMTGAGLANASTDPAALAGLAHLTLIFEGGTGVVDDFEAAGRDLGTDPAGWTDNFALDVLQLGGDQPGRIRLVDLVDNQPASAGAEALYVETLTLNPGAAAELGALGLYYRNGGQARQFFNGDATLNGAVNYFDLGILATNYGKSGVAWPEGDFTGDGVVSYLDVGILATNYGAGGSPPPAGGPASAPVPEPATAILLALAALALRRRRRGTPPPQAGPLPSARSAGGKAG